MTRMEAAERAVIEAVLRQPLGWNAVDGGAEGTALLSLEIVDAAARLRALREQAKAEECGAIYWDEPYRKTVTCHLPRGHEREHEGSLGLYVWVDGDAG